MKPSRINQIGPPRFGIAVHALVWLANSGGVLSSAVIAGQVNSHSTFLRRVLALLTQFGIVEAREGRDGGYYLKIPADRLTLADVYIAVKSECTEVCTESDVDCGEAGKQLDYALERIMSEAEDQTITWLKRYTLADLMQGIDFGPLTNHPTCNE
ncbi:Rrf2 family transcriptional regulator [Paenibacillus sp. N3.4]|uniref:RrF2 family transcriptional regulator n=1 Tax=Paenibacillus sp. N3.4 TaxID=2603222 RepID=UPI0011C8AE90|nr:Rrf2 family transcriptional regulator [Paenibacillus sp. N3.4]TXK83890.1 Rrf2 family transcriptional regulator [Paenibacillus sp. N3.4]